MRKKNHILPNLQKLNRRMIFIRVQKQENQTYPK